MGIKSEKTFEEIVERIVALFRPLHSSDAREFDNSDHEGNNGRMHPTGNANANSKGDGDHNLGDASAAPPPSAASQDSPQLADTELRLKPKKTPSNSPSI